jgi:hypothetical protein
MSDLIEVLKNYSIEQLMSLKRSIVDDRAGLVKQIENLQHTIDHLLDQQQLLLTGTPVGADGSRLPLLGHSVAGGTTATFAASQSTLKSLGAERELASLQRQAADWAREKSLLLEQREELLAQLKRFAEATEVAQVKAAKRRAREAQEKERREKEKHESAEQVRQLSRRSPLNSTRSPRDELPAQRWAQANSASRASTPRRSMRPTSSRRRNWPPPAHCRRMIIKPCSHITRPRAMHCSQRRSHCEHSRPRSK